jgi:hypothetical protein
MNAGSNIQTTNGSPLIFTGSSVLRGIIAAGTPASVQFLGTTSVCACGVQPHKIAALSSPNHCLFFVGGR